MQQPHARASRRIHSSKRWSDSNLSLRNLPSLGKENDRLKALYPLDGRFVGSGHFTTIRACEQNGKTFAIKIFHTFKMPPREIAEIDQEIRFLRKLDHPRIVRLLDTFRGDSDTICCVMDYFSRDLFDLIEDGGGFKQGHYEIILQIAEGIDYLHTNGVCHRNIKSENILINGDGTARNRYVVNIIDFSSAIDLDSNPGSTNHNNELVGTWGFFAPELVTRDGSDPRAADMWSFGCTVMELAISHGDFQRWHRRYEAIMADEHPSRVINEDLRKELSAVIQKYEAFPVMMVIAGLLQVNIDFRLTAADALAWLRDDDNNTLEDDHEDATSPCGSPLY